MKIILLVVSWSRNKEGGVAACEALGEYCRRDARLATFLGMIPDDKTLTRWCESRVWSKVLRGQHCPSDSIKDKMWHGIVTRCYRARTKQLMFSYGSDYSNEINEGTRLSYRIGAIAICLFAKRPEGVS
ncbi:MAG: hypothetical protein OXC63_14310 [Aestuariivita sp.]|nr:hypothetical protein [Aestuariivita sp.]MCY4347628.1 hypothetical protein [Aestuariivita sp.]